MTTAPPTLAERLADAVAAVRRRLPAPARGWLATVQVRLSSGLNACERVTGTRIFGEWWSQYHTILFFSGRCEGLTDAELEALAAHEMAHAYAFLTGRGGDEDTANALMQRWGFDPSALPGYAARMARGGAIALGGMSVDHAGPA
jgi:hypothetical protein